MPKLTMVEAINLALKQEMSKDKNVIIMGEDVGKDGGVFRVTDGLINLYGSRRVIDTPLAESAIVGTAIGMAIAGLKPVAEIQFEGFTFPAIDQLVNHASRMRNRSRGRFTVPLVIRSPIGGGIKALEHHSDSPETYFVHTPGLKVVIPGTPYDAKGLMISAIRDPDPVIFFEPKRVYRSIKEEVPEKEYTIPIGKANIIKPGKDLTLITYGGIVKTAVETSFRIKDVDIEVLDLRTLSPLDIESILDSVKKTGRVIIAHEAPRTLGLGAEIAAQIYEKALNSLKAPIERVTGYDIIMPLRKYEYLNDITPEKILNAVRKVMSYAN
jgi:pyruvate dehydrogenase E1 component beta subunit